MIGVDVDGGLVVQSGKLLKLIMHCKLDLDNILVTTFHYYFFIVTW